MAVPAVRALLFHAACVADAAVNGSLRSGDALLVGDVVSVLCHVQRQTRVVHAHHERYEVSVHTAVEPLEHALQLVALVLDDDVLARHGEGVVSSCSCDSLEIVAVGSHLALALRETQSDAQLHGVGNLHPYSRVATAPCVVCSERYFLVFAHSLQTCDSLVEVVKHLLIELLLAVEAIACFALRVDDRRVGEWSVSVGSLHCTYSLHDTHRTSKSI